MSGPLAIRAISLYDARAMSEIIFEVREDELGGGFTASALGLGIHSEGDTLEELRENVREAVDCYFDETMDAPRIIRLHFVRDEVLARRGFHGTFPVLI
jgi:hypothetical protein